MNIVITILLSTVKFGMTFPLAIIEYRFSFFETILWINIGGVIGVYFFAYVSEGLIRWIRKLVARKRKKLSGQMQEQKQEKKRKVFTSRNRRIIRIKNRYGLIGIALSTPLLLSIPLGVFLVARYYSLVRTRYLYLVGANVIWSFIYTPFYMFWHETLFSG